MESGSFSELQQSQPRRDIMPDSHEEGHEGTGEEVTSPVQRWINASSWTREDIELALTALGVFMSALTVLSIYVSGLGSR